MAHILVLEDDDSNANLVAAICRQEGHSVAIAHSGTEGIACLAAEKFDLLIVDWVLAGMSGLDFTRALRLDPAHGQVPILGLTGMVRPADQALLREAGMDDVMSKPFRRQALSEAVTRLLDGVAPPGAER